ncbi:MAG TPA: hypothetical protein VJ741_03580 [Solirubrobacteraceae bacterium]|nr:hypothetical protein [Solirubrobacteraceae bacterium]
MRFSSLVRRRPSASLVVSFVALFVALGGVGYAATQLPRNSVGNAQLRNGSVGNWKLKFNAVGGRKIINGAVGARQVNSTQVQLRVGSPCPTGAIKSIGLSGTVTCTPTLPNEVGTSAAAVTLGAGSTQAATESLPAGSSYLVLAYPHAVISGATGQRVQVDCTLSVPPGTGTSTTTKSLAVEVGSSSHSQAGTIPLVLPVASSSSAQAATVSCTDSATPSTPAPTVTVDSTLNAIQTAANG